MVPIALMIASIALYGISSILLIRAIRSHTTTNPLPPSQVFRPFLIGCVGVFFHALYAFDVSLAAGSLDLSLRSMVVLTSGLVTLIFVLGATTLPIRRLGILVFPITILCLLFAQLWGSEASLLADASLMAKLHIVVSILAYSLLAIAAIQALLYSYQEHQFKQRKSPAMLMALPPLQTMELLLFRLLWTGFALLTLTLLTGALFSQEIFGRPFELKHHTILATMGWLVYAVLLIKRLTMGVRGSQAVWWTIGGFLLIQLGYFGTKIVLETLAVQ